MPPRNKVKYKSAVHAPSLSPVDVLSNNKAAQALFGDYRDSIGLLHQQMKIARGRLGQQMHQVRDARFQEVQQVAGAANERGVLGSSMDLLARNQVKDNALNQQQELRNQFAENRLGNLAQQMQARRDYETGILNLQMMKKAMQSQKNADNFFNNIGNILDDGTDSGGGKKNKGDKNKGGGGQAHAPGTGGSGYNPKGGNSYQELLAELRSRQAAGFTGNKFLAKHDKFAKQYKQATRSGGKAGGPMGP